LAIFRPVQRIAPGFTTIRFRCEESERRPSDSVTPKRLSRHLISDDPTKKASSVDEYIAAAPKEAQGKLREVRAAIKEVAPAARESISYGMAYYSYKGRLAWFGLHTAHIGLYLRPPILHEHESELAAYQKTKSSLHLPLDRKVPVALVKKLVRAAMKKNEAKE
jgi:uncharacterized protein YdhG (YjbR/CyaY superfamily)